MISSRSLHLLSSLLACAAMLAAAGCATPLPASRVAAPAALAANEGVVLLKVTSLEHVSLLATKWRTLDVEDVGSGKRFTLGDKGSSGSLYAVFSGALPTGRYKIASMDAAGASPMQWGLLVGLVIQGMTSNSREGQDAGTFTVEPGHLTNLGLVLNANGGDHPANVVLADGAALKANLDDLDDASRARLEAMPTRVWDQAVDDSAARAAASRLVRTRATRIALDFPGDGRVLVGTPLGEVHERLPSGEWRVHETGSADNIRVVRVLSDGRIFAAADTSRYFVLGTDGAVLARPVPGGALASQVEPLDDGAVAVLAQKFTAAATPVLGMLPAERHVLVAKDPLSLDGATELRPLLAPESGDGPMGMSRVGGELLMWVNHSGITRTGDLYRADLGSLQMRKEDTPYWSRGYYRASRTLIVRERANGLSRYADFSVDDGRTWTQGQDSTPTWGAHYVDTKNGWGLDKVSTGWSSVSATLVQTTDGGKTWTPRGKTVEVKGGEVQVHPVDDRLFVYTGSALLSTADQGNSWQQEWPRAE